MGISIVAALVLLACFWRAFYLKARYPYKGRHHFGKTRLVWQTYHPTDSMNWDGLEPSQEAFGLWVARMGRDRRYPMLYMPLMDLFIAIERKRLAA